jgi:hypothetical protein
MAHYNEVLDLESDDGDPQANQCSSVVNSAIDLENELSLLIDCEARPLTPERHIEAAEDEQPLDASESRLVEVGMPGLQSDNESQSPYTQDDEPTPKRMKTAADDPIICDSGEQCGNQQSTTGEPGRGEGRGRKGRGRKGKGKGKDPRCRVGKGPSEVASLINSEGASISKDASDSTGAVTPESSQAGAQPSEVNLGSSQAEPQPTKQSNDKAKTKAKAKAKPKATTKAASPQTDTNGAAKERPQGVGEGKVKTSPKQAKDTSDSASQSSAQKTLPKSGGASTGTSKREKRGGEKLGDAGTSKSNKKGSKKSCDAVDVSGESVAEVDSTTKPNVPGQPEFRDIMDFIQKSSSKLKILPQEIFRIKSTKLMCKQMAATDFKELQKSIADNFDGVCRSVTMYTGCDIQQCGP